MSQVNLKNRPGELAILDGLRGLAALYVVIGHARWLLWEGFANFQVHRQDYGVVGRLSVYGLSAFRFGHEAVLFFFVLSGFVIHLRYAGKLAEEGRAARFDWEAFVWRRARRLYPPFLAALALGWVLVKIGSSAGFPIYHAATPYPVINLNVLCDVSGKTLLGNMAFLMNTYVPVFGANGPLWSLKFEWWFYMVYPVFWWLSRQTLVGATALMTLLFFLAHLGKWPVLLLQDVFSEMLYWWLGVLLADVFVGRLRVAWPAVAATALAGCGLTRLVEPWHDLSLAFFFSVLLALGFEAKKRCWNLACLERLKPLGDMSYTLYVIHFPFLMLASGWLMSRSSGGLLPTHTGWVFAGVALALLVGYSIHRVAERPFLNRQGTL